MKLKSLLALLLCAVMLFGFAGCAASKKDTQYWDETTWKDADGNVYLVTVGGKKLALDKGEDGMISPDGKKAVIWNEEGGTARVVTVKSGKSKAIPLDDSRAIAGLGAEGAYGDVMLFEVELYTDNTKEDMTGELWLYSLKQNKFFLKLGYEKTTSLTTARNDTGKTALAYVEDGTLYTYVLGDKKPENRGSIDKEATLQYVSPNGRTVVWAERTTGSDGKKTDTIRMLYKKKTIDVTTVQDAKFSRYGVDGSKDGNYTVVYDGEKLYQISKNKVKSETAMAFSSVYSISVNAYTDDGPLSESKGSVKGIYALSEDSLYYITVKGDKTKLATSVTSFNIKDGHIQYRKNGDLYAAKVKKDKLKDELKLKADAYVGEFSEDGKYAYFGTLDGALYAYRFGDKSAKKVAEDVRTYYITRDGKKAVYLADFGTDTSRGGTLKVYTYKSDKSTTIAEGVRYIQNGPSEYIDAKSFNYAEYSSTKGESMYLYDVKHCNGKKGKTILEGVH